MRIILAVLALAGALIPCTPAGAFATATHVAQMSRDVTGAVRKQRGKKDEPPRRPDNRTTCEGRR